MWEAEFLDEPAHQVLMIPNRSTSTIPLVIFRWGLTGSAIKASCRKGPPASIQARGRLPQAPQRPAPVVVGKAHRAGERQGKFGQHRPAVHDDAALDLGQPGYGAGDVLLESACRTGCRG